VNTTRRMIYLIAIARLFRLLAITTRISLLLLAAAVAIFNSPAEGLMVLGALFIINFGLFTTHKLILRALQRLHADVETEDKRGEII